MVALVFSFLAACGLALVLTPVVRATARKTGLIAPVARDRWHRQPTALAGGGAIFGALFLALVVVFVVVDLRQFGGLEVLAPYGWGLLGAATLMFAAGLADDCVGLRPASKLILQGLAAAIAVSFDVVYPITPWTAVNILATIFWFIALTNAINLLDNMDGVAVGVAGIAAVFLAATFSLDGNWLLAVICAALAGATAGFLPYNFHPASIFMGDSGSLFLGALLAGLGAVYPSTVSSSIVSVLFVPLIIVVIPILDTVFVTVTRTLAGRPVAVGGRDHTTHRLVAMGLSERQAMLLLYLFASLGGAVALLVWMSELAFGLWISGLFLTVLAVLAAYLSRLHTYAPDVAVTRSRTTVLVSNLLYKRRAFEVVLDLVLFGLAYYGAYLVRWDGGIPANQEQLLENTLALAVASQSVAFGLMGVYRGVWQQTTVVDAYRIIKATLLGTSITLAGTLVMFPAVVAGGVFATQALLVGFLTLGARASVRSLDLLRVSLNRTGARALVYGAGKGGELLLRELSANPELGLDPVGFVDDDSNKKGRLVHGLPVRAGIAELDTVVQKYDVEAIVVATSKLRAERRERLIRLCSKLDVRLLELDLALKKVSDDRSSNADESAVAVGSASNPHR